ncbi:MAG TPA: divalent-cation tolerance protein CutA [Actinomycetes bacterium]|jgi:periplasmic divalent cation tolerance protein|nr:divalent-cation tolerance protein CutA [Actinomycetes bacterium]
MTDSYLQVTTAIDSKQAAERLARGIVEARLAACVQVLGPVASTYRWQGRIETAEEWLCLAKTTAGRFEALAAHVRAGHPYETPEITATPISRGSGDYLGWVSSETAG